EVVEKERVAQVRARVPAVEPEPGQEGVAEVGEGREMARGVASRRHRRKKEERRLQVVDEDEQDRGQAEEIDEEGAQPCNAMVADVAAPGRGGHSAGVYPTDGRWRRDSLASRRWRR